MHTFIEPSVRQRWRERDESHNLRCVPRLFIPLSPPHLSHPVTAVVPLSGVSKHPQNHRRVTEARMTAGTPLGGSRCAQNSIFPRKNSIFPSGAPPSPSFSFPPSFSSDSLKNSPLTAASFCDKSIARLSDCTSYNHPFPLSLPSIFHFSSTQPSSSGRASMHRPRGLDCLPR